MEVPVGQSGTRTKNHESEYMRQPALLRLRYYTAHTGNGPNKTFLVTYGADWMQEEREEIDRTAR